MGEMQGEAARKRRKQPNLIKVLSHVWIFRWIPVHQTIAFPKKHELQSQSKYPKLRKTLNKRMAPFSFV